jgi:hypothetical protein
MQRETWAVVTVLVLCAGTAFSPALGENEVAKLLPADGALEDYFGHAVAVSGSAAVIGMQYDDDNGENSGSAYVFHFENGAWVQQAKLLPDDGEASDKFGVSVAIDGNTIIVGAEEDDDTNANAGSAYVFRFDGSSWVQQAKLLGVDDDADALFGHSVAVSGETVLIGTPGHNLLNQYTRSAYVFRFDGSSWVQEAKLAASDGADADLYGITVDLDGDTAVIGAPYDDVVDRDSGSVYVFHFDGADWVEQQKVVPADGAKLDSFGASVALLGNTLLVGAPRVGEDDYYGGDWGAAYAFQFDGTSWMQQAQLLAWDAAAYDLFGSAVALDGNTAIIAAPGDDGAAESNAGSAHVFRFNGETWIDERKIEASDRAAWDRFGCAVALSGNTAVVGALRNDDQDTNSGSAYVFDVTPCPGDYDGDRDVDLDDLAHVLGNYGTSEGATYQDGDFDGDGDVDLADLADFLGYYGDDCG